MGEILFLAHRVPFPPDRGDKIRAHHILRKLASLGPVHVGCLAESREDRMARQEVAEIAASYCIANRSKPLALAGVEAVLSAKPVSLTAFHSTRLENWVRETIRIRDISTIVVFSGQMGQYVPDDFSGRVIIDLCDVDSAKFENYAADGERVWINAREGRLLSREEERLGRRADATILISEDEASVYRKRLHSSDGIDIYAIGNGIDAKYFDPSNVAAKDEIIARPGPHFMFTGQMDYRPNEQAALWVIETLMEPLRVIFPTAEFHVVGRNPTATLKKHSGAPGVTIWGGVSDIRPYIASAHCILTPLTIARGVQNKVLEAMAMERPVLLTPEAATGISARNGIHWMVEHADAGPMCATIQALLANEADKLRIGREARRFVLENHDWDAKLAPLARLVRGQGRQHSHAA